METIVQDIKQKIKTTWVLEFSDILYTWALSKTSSKETAEDLVQETFLTAFASFDQFENKDQPKTWLFALLNTKIIAHYRKKKDFQQRYDQISENQANYYSGQLFDENGKWKVTDQSSIWKQEEQPSDNAAFNEILGNCMAELPENWSLALSAKYILEEDSSQICQELEISPTNYWQLLHRAKLLLKSCIEKNWKE